MNTSLSHIATIIVGVLTFISSFGQQTNNLILTNGRGLSFQGDTLHYFKTGSTNYPAHMGQASVSDEQGNLLFYYADHTVFNKFHEQMENNDTITAVSSDGTLYGGEQNGIIVKNPIEEGIYYLVIPSSYSFKIYEKNSELGLHIYKIDVNANKGKGRVISKENNLFSNYLVNSITSTLHKNETKVWIACRFGKPSNEYPDSIGLVLFDGSKFIEHSKYYFPYRDGKILMNGDANNCLVFSNHGDFIAENFSDMEVYNPNLGSDSAKTYIALYNFDKEKGTISSKRYLHYYSEVRKFHGNTPPLDYLKKKHSYITNPCFSPNDSFVYTIDKVKPDGNTFDLIQFKTSEQDSYKKAGILRFNNTNIVSLGLAPNNKIYINYFEVNPNSSFRISKLHCINYPDKYFPNMLLEKGVFTFPPNVSQGIETHFWFPKSPYKEKRIHFLFSGNNCLAPSFLKNLSDTLFKKFTWYFDETVSIKANKKEDLSFPFTKSKKYSVKLKGETNAGWTAWYSDTIDYLHPPKADLSFNTSVGCKYIAFNFKNMSVADTIKSTGGFSHWFFGDGTDTIIYGSTLNNITQNASHTYTKSGVYTVQLIFSNGFCSDTIEKKNSVFIKDAPKPGISVSNTSGCQPLTINIKRSYLDTIVAITYDFGDGNSFNSPPLQFSADAPTNHSYISSGKFLIKQSIEGSTGCITLDSIEITILKGFENTIPNLKYASIIGDTASILEWDAFDASIKYSLLRSEDKLQWTEIAKLNTATIAYCDKSILPKKRNYWYKLRAFDTCDNIRESNIASTLLLTGSADNNDFSVIEWQPYEEWQGGVLKYSIETLLKGQWKEIASIGQVRYTDYSFSDEEGVERCYRITAIENGGGTTLSSSNSLCLPYSPVIWIPNGFTPNNDGLNDTFSISTLGIKKLTITIYNSYGEEIYSCNGVDCNWNGEHKGVPCIEGVYSYIVSARTGEDKLINHRGTITLLR